MEPWRQAERQPIWKRLAWMAAIWAASVVVLGVFAELLKVWIG